MANPENPNVGILTVDDEPAVLLLLKLMLKKIPCATTYTADNGQDALTKIEEIAPLHSQLLVITDLNMPDIQGDELVRRIREHTNPKVQTAPVIVSSAQPANRTVFECLRNETAGVGQLEFLPKPIFPHVLLATILRLLTPS